MDLFAAILVTITATTICGICLFIFVCALQPRFLRKLQRKTSRAYRDTESNISSNKNEDEHDVKSLDLAIQSREPTTDNPETSLQSNNRDKKAYLKALERSLRTGRRIQDEDNDINDENDSHSTPFKFIRNCINKHISGKTSNSLETTEL